MEDEARGSALPHFLLHKREQIPTADFTRLRFSCG